MGLIFLMYIFDAFWNSILNQPMKFSDLPSAISSSPSQRLVGVETITVTVRE
jgi:hypothetical protein